MDKSALKTVPIRRLEVVPNHMGKQSGFLLVAVVQKPDGAKTETLLCLEALPTELEANRLAESTARLVEQITGVMYSYPTQGPAKLEVVNASQS